jgi:precorrin-6B methylase 2
MTLEELRGLISRLAISTQALSLIGAALEARSSDHPEVRVQRERALAALGVGDLIARLSAAELRPALGEIRVTLHHALARLGGGHAATWTPSAPELLQAAGDVSAGFPAILRRLLPHLDGLATRLERPGASFLDVGAGVAALSIEMARSWSALRVVGIDVWAPSLALARENVQKAGLEARVELREQAGEALTEEAAFDLAWLPTAFVPGPAIPEILRRLHRALRPGGWILFPVARPTGDPLVDSLTALRTAEWGGHPWTPSDGERLLADAGFTGARTLPGAPTAAFVFVAAHL